MKAVYPPHFIRVSRAQQQAWLAHLAASGYPLKHNTCNSRDPRDASENWVAASCPLYGTHCVVAKTEQENGRAVHHIIIRLLDTATARRERERARARKLKAKTCGS